MKFEVIFKANNGQPFLGTGVYRGDLHNGGSTQFMLCGFLAKVRGDKFDPRPCAVRAHADMLVLSW